MEITCLNGELTISKMENNHRTDVKTLQVTHPGDEIREIIKEYKSPVINGLPPLSGGLVGYFSYDYIKYAEPSLKFSNKRARDSETWISCYLIQLSYLTTMSRKSSL